MCVSVLVAFMFSGVLFVVVVVVDLLLSKVSIV